MYLEYNFITWMKQGFLYLITNNKKTALFDNRAPVDYTSFSETGKPEPYTLCFVPGLLSSLPKFWIYYIQQQPNILFEKDTHNDSLTSVPWFNEASSSRIDCIISFTRVGRLFVPEKEINIRINIRITCYEF